jgi:hypothetical protein
VAITRTKVIRVTRPIVGEIWRATDEKGEHAEEFYLDEKRPFVRDGVEVTLLECMGARLVGYFRGVWSLEEGWILRQFMKDLPRHLRF